LLDDATLMIFWLVPYHKQTPHKNRCRLSSSISSNIIPNTWIGCISP